MASLGRSGRHINQFKQQIIENYALQSPIISPNASQARTYKGRPIQSTPPLQVFYGDELQSQDEWIFYQNGEGD